MKMQNAEMEFISFDAQDIIATSGGPKTAKFTVSSKLLDGTEWSDIPIPIQNFYSPAEVTWNGANNSYSQTFMSFNPILKNGSTYVLTEGAQYSLEGKPGVVGQSGEIGIYSGATEGNVADEELRSLSAIADWLTQYGVPMY